jgi:hypothetical protein
MRLPLLLGLLQGGKLFLSEQATFLSRPGFQRLQSLLQRLQIVP